MGVGVAVRQLEVTTEDPGAFTVSGTIAQEAAVVVAIEGAEA